MRSDDVPPSEHGASDRDLILQSGQTGAVALLAVVSGLALDATVAAVFGAGRDTDALFVAMRMPLLFSVVLMLVGNQSLVPSFSRWLVTRGLEATSRTISQFLAVTLLLGLAVSGVLFVAAEPIVRLTAPGLAPAQHAAATEMAQILAATVPVTALTETLRAFLNARSSFAAPAGMNIALNTVAVGLILWFRGPIAVVAWAYLLGTVARLAYVAGLARVRGFRLSSGLRPLDPEVTKTLRLSVRPLAGGSLMPTARIGEQMVASFLPPGSISILNYGYRVIMAIGGTVFLRSVSLTVVPRLAEAAARLRQDLIVRTTALGLRLLVIVSVSLTVFLVTLSRPFATLVFQRGSFGRESALRLGAVMTVLALGLVGSALQRALLAPALAELDMRTPLRNTVYGAAANILLLLPLVLPFRGRPAALLGVAMANTIAQYVMAAHAWHRVAPTMRVSLPWLRRSFRGVTLPALAATAVMLTLGAALHLGAAMPKLALAARAAGVGTAGAAALGLGLALTCRGSLAAIRAQPGPTPLPEPLQPTSTAS